VFLCMLFWDVTLCCWYVVLEYDTVMLGMLFWDMTLLLGVLFWDVTLCFWACYSGM